MLTPILATADPYRAADEFVANGWTLVFATPAESGDRLAAVDLHGSRVMLGVDDPEFLVPEARNHRGAGVEFYVEVPADRIAEVHASHRAPGELTTRPWGVRAFQVTLAGYRFLVATPEGDV